MRFSAHPRQVANENTYAKTLLDSGELGMAPFKMSRMYVSYEYDIDFHRYRILVEAVLVGGFTFAASTYIDANDLLDTPELCILKAAREITEAFRDREDYSLAPLICLGEN